MNRHDHGMPCCGPRDVLMDLTRQESTASLVAVVRMLDELVTALPAGDERAAHMVARAAAYDVLTERHDLDQLIDGTFSDLEFTGTYTDAVLSALKARGIPGRGGWAVWS